MLSLHPHVLLVLHHVIHHHLLHGHVLVHHVLVLPQLLRCELGVVAAHIRLL